MPNSLKTFEVCFVLTIIGNWTKSFRLIQLKKWSGSCVFHWNGIGSLMDKTNTVTEDRIKKVQAAILAGPG